MPSRKRDIQPRFGPSNRVLELAQHKTSKSVWATTPCGKLTWGDQEPMWPVSASALAARPSARIQNLACSKRDFSAREDHRRKEEEASSSRKTPRPSSEASRYERIVRLSTPRSRSCSAQEAGPLHGPRCDNNCPIWHVDPRATAAVVTARLLQLAIPKAHHPDFRSNRENVASVVSFASKTAQVSQRLVRLSLPRLKRSGVCHELGRPAEPIWTVSKAALRATASARLETLATPKPLSEDYVPSRDPEWRRTKVVPQRDPEWSRTKVVPQRDPGWSRTKVPSS
ncbi:testicular haploid expressed gene protein-like [Pseudoliparis swirei]|uniref:testicular haploid expressed gene protein-like n=1 Tax=Pseudoliparis swirei TaxID=2059687 RepID=UPI0024BED93C|nr:testicular haploid expressed gene protein-like [Pseudoliparis swirei]XP_056296234.1 testicular haploid expressed gene protein-like [Pseudoliparis swirei]